MKSRRPTFPNKLKNTYFLLFLALFSACAGGKKASNQKIETVIKTARSYTGTPYKFGGTTRSGMDCSGLLLVSYKAIDAQIPRTSAEQSKFGSPVRMEELRPGDWVFFAAGKSRRKITHVGLVTEVKGRKEVKFIHASSSLGVIENNLYSDYYQKIFVKARRPF